MKEIMNEQEVESVCIENETNSSSVKSRTASVLETLNKSKSLTKEQFHEAVAGLSLLWPRHALEVGDAILTASTTDKSVLVKEPDSFILNNIVSCIIKFTKNGEAYTVTVMSENDKVIGANIKNSRGQDVTSGFLNTLKKLEDMLGKDYFKHVKRS